MPPASPTPRVELPASAVVTGIAAGAADELSISCGLDFTANLHAVGDEQHGSMGGHAHRQVLNPDGSGTAFTGDAFYPDIRITVSSGGRATITSYRNGAPMMPTGESRFWDNLLSFEGTYDAASRTISGSWTCRPMDTRDDVKGDATGSWTLRAAGAPPQ